MGLSLADACTQTTFGNKYVRFLDVTFDSSYPTSGESLLYTDVGFNVEIDLLIAAPSGGLIFEYNHTTHKLLAFYPSGGATAPATNVAPVVTATTAVPVATAGTATLASAPIATGGSSAVPAGATPVTSTGAQPTLTEVQPTISAPAITVVQPTISAAVLTAAVVAGKGKEVGNTTNLSAVTTRVMVIGI